MTIEYNDPKEMIIVDGKIKNLRLNGSMSTRTKHGQDANLTLCLDMEGYPAELFIKRAWEGIKLQARTATFKKGTKEEAESYNNKLVSWSEILIAKDANTKAAVKRVELEKIQDVTKAAKGMKDGGMNREQIKQIIAGMSLGESDQESILNMLFG